ncbi:coiled-coil domain-containing protein [Marinobacterium jannaschii]|uniref:hypothetical protein n=1 Tax=Marinobacterium jannaschii TaxID=64970 RepID=UPI000484F678|nr:hypothetical protein [Marinobacterium jannaschii]
MSSELDQSDTYIPDDTAHQQPLDEGSNSSEQPSGGNAKPVKSVAKKKGGKAFKIIFFGLGGTLLVAAGGAVFFTFQGGAASGYAGGGEFVDVPPQGSAVAPTADPQPVADGIPPSSPNKLVDGLRRELEAKNAASAQALASGIPTPTDAASSKPMVGIAGTGDLQEIQNRIAALEDAANRAESMIALEVQRRVSQLQRSHSTEIQRANQRITNLENSMDTMIRDVSSVRQAIQKHNGVMPGSSDLVSRLVKVEKLAADNKKNFGWLNHRACKTEAVALGTVKRACKGLVEDKLIKKGRQLHQALYDIVPDMPQIAASAKSSGNATAMVQPDLSVQTAQERAQKFLNVIQPPRPVTAATTQGNSGYQQQPNQRTYYTGHSVSPQYQAQQPYNPQQMVATQNVCSFANNEWRIVGITSNRAWIRSRDGKDIPVERHVNVPGLGIVQYIEASSFPRYVQFTNGIVCGA